LFLWTVTHDFTSSSEYSANRISSETFQSHKV
jgi:hypothetical protein